MNTTYKVRASSAHRAKTCPGSVRLEIGKPDTQSPEASEGTMLHEVLAGTPHELTGEQQETIDRVKFYELELIRQVFGEDAGKPEREVELYYRDGNLEIIATGHGDTIYSHARKTLIIDYKFGRIAVDRAEQNTQLRWYALMASGHTADDHVFVSVIQPRLPKAEAVSLAEYKEHDLDLAAKELEQIVERANSPTAPLSPSSDACRYCKAKTECPAAHGELAVIAATGFELSGENIALLLEKSEVASKVIDAIKAEAKRRLEADPASVPGWGLKAGKKSRAIKDAQAAYNVLSEDLTPVEFTSCCKVSLPDIEESYRKKTGCKIKDAKTTIEYKLAALIETKQAAPSLERTT